MNSCTVCVPERGDATGSAVHNGIQMKSKLDDVSTTDFPFWKSYY